MIHFMRTVKQNTWEPESMDMSRIEHECHYIRHAAYQDICILLERKKYIEVVIRKTSTEEVFYRFIVAPDYYWSDEEEELFCKLVQNENMAYSGYHLLTIYERFAEQYPQWHLKKYTNKPLRLMDHIHHCQQRGTVKEILYKSGLDEIAAKIEKIDEYNMIGNSPAEIFSGLNMRLLRAVNIPEGIELLEENWKRDILLKLQNTYAWMFENTFNAFLCKYLNELIEEEYALNEIAEKFRIHYKKMSDFWIDAQYQNYKIFIHQKECVRNTLKEFITEKELNSKDDLFVRQIYNYLIKNKASWDKKIEDSNKKRNPRYEWKDYQYSVHFPKNTKEFILEAIIQKNCLMEYLESFTDNITDILFLRQVGNEKDSFVTMEIYQGKIVQAYAKCNKIPNEKVQDWIKRYAEYVGVEVSERCFDENVEYENF
ncbi:MAG: PcfJ domain-containing protein [Lachnospiraceae bacterium]|nr:PcfJ domain-containing protein [Lachnospiraceae bacterium]